MSRLGVRTLWWGVLLLAATAPPASAQDDWDARRRYATREILEDLLMRLEASSQSGAYSEALRGHSKEEANVIRERLEEGDYRPGDRVWLEVVNETTLTDTFTVERGPALRLPDVGTVSLDGVLRAELEPHLQTHLSRYIRDPEVKAKTLIRLTFMGGVGAPGFYIMPSELVFTDALMAVGGPGGSAKLDEIKVERDGKTLWSGDVLEQAIAQGRTLDQLNLRAGDRIVVPSRGTGLGGAFPVIRSVMLLLSLPAAIFGLSRFF